MKLFIKDDMVGMVLTKTELAALYAGHAESLYDTVIRRLNEAERLIGKYQWTKEDDSRIYRELERFLTEHHNG